MNGWSPSAVIPARTADAEGAAARPSGVRAPVAMMQIELVIEALLLADNGFFEVIAVIANRQNALPHQADARMVGLDNHCRQMPLMLLRVPVDVRLETQIDFRQDKREFATWRQVLEFND